MDDRLQLYPCINKMKNIYPCIIKMKHIYPCIIKMKNRGSQNFKYIKHYILAFTNELAFLSCSCIVHN